MDELAEILNGIDIKDLKSSAGVKFDITKIQDVFNEDGNEEDLLPIPGTHTKSTVSDPVAPYPEESFETLWNKLQPIEETGRIRKRVITEGRNKRPNEDSIVNVLYCVYVEGSNIPIGHNRKDAYFKCKLNESGLLCGVLYAILSMAVGERSQFLIHHSLMYGELGCPPIIPKKAMCLLHIVLSSVSNNTEASDDFAIETNLLPPLQKALHKAENINKEARRHFDNNNYSAAVNSFKKALHLMIACRLADHYEEEQQKDFLLKQYYILGVCYNRMKLPFKCCLMFNEYHKVGNIYKSSRALYENAKALIAIGGFQEAMKKLKQALVLEPKNVNIKKDLDDLESKIDSNEKFNRNLTEYMQAFSPQKENSDKIVDEFLDEMEEIYKLFVNDGKSKYKFDIPPGLSTSETYCIVNKFTQLGLNVNLDQSSNVVELTTNSKSKDQSDVTEQ